MYYRVALFEYIDKETMNSVTKSINNVVLISGTIIYSCICFAGVTLTPIGGYETGLTDEDAAEINAFDSVTQKLFVVNGSTDSIDVLDLSDPGNPLYNHSIEISAYGSAANSVAVIDGLLAVAIESDPKQDPGSVVFFNAANYRFLNQLKTGALPDMLTFTPDGKYLLVANEGEPDDDYSIDPEGSISIIQIGKKDVTRLKQSDVRTARFNRFTPVRNRQSVRIFGPNASAAQDFEPEYIAAYKSRRYRHARSGGDYRYSWKAMVTLQENNAVAIVDVERARIESVAGLGFKNHNRPVNAIDASDKDSGIEINSWPVYGMYQPDAIASFTSNGRPYFIIANEGDARDYDGFSEEDRIEDITLDNKRFPNAAELQKEDNLGRLKITNTLGDVDKDGDYDYLFSYGARSLSILNRHGDRLFDSHSQFEFITASSVRDSFNSQGLPNSFDSRSDDKGSEPEGVATGRINARQYAFVGLERTGGIITYDVTQPAEPFFVNYTNTATELGDIAPEGITFVSSEDSPNGNPLLIVSFEFSGSTRIFEITE